MHFVIDLRQSCAFRRAHRRRRMRRTWKSCRQTLIASVAEVGDRLCHRPQSLLKQFTNLVISSFLGNNLVASENPARVGIHDKDRIVAGIEQDGIGALGPASMPIEQFFPKLVRGACEQSCPRPLILSIEILNEDFQPFGFLPEIARGTNQALEFSQRCAPDSFQTKQAGGTKIRQSFLDVRPSRVLRQISADNHLKPRLRRPPMLRSPRVKQGVIVGSNLIVSRIQPQTSSSIASVYAAAESRVSGAEPAGLSYRSACTSARFSVQTFRKGSFGAGSRAHPLNRLLP